MLLFGAKSSMKQQRYFRVAYCRRALKNGKHSAAHWLVLNQALIQVQGLGSRRVECGVTTRPHPVGTQPSCAGSCVGVVKTSDVEPETLPLNHPKFTQKPWGTPFLDKRMDSQVYTASNSRFQECKICDLESSERVGGCPPT